MRKREGLRSTVLIFQGDRECQAICYPVIENMTLFIFPGHVVPTVKIGVKCTKEKGL